MIAPNMATMLSVVMTDAPLSPAQADSLLRHAVDRSFNCISVEGHRSTSDTVILLAGGAAGTGPLDDAGLAAVGRMLDEVTAELAQMIVRDGEGASHFIVIDVRGTRTRDEAVRIARSVADSPLCMTAITGGDPNWGRFVSACGYAGVPLREEDITLHINGMLLYEKGTPVAHDPQAVSKSILASRDTSVELDLTLGDAACRFWTCDLTAEYIRLNAEYTT
jgi:glutamate N-acetyltransferase/amino-acid N-acetyltransferase